MTSVVIVQQPSTEIRVESAAMTQLLESNQRGPQGEQGPEGPQGADYAPPELRSATANGYTYLGRAELGTDEADETWTIARFSVVDGAVGTEHATGSWTDRETLSYE